MIGATLTTSDKDYLVTAGIFNLKDDVAAKQAHEEIKELVDKEKGGSPASSPRRAPRSSDGPPPSSPGTRRDTSWRTA